MTGKDLVDSMTVRTMARRNPRSPIHAMLVDRGVTKMDLDEMEETGEEDVTSHRAAVWAQGATQRWSGTQE
ncbi:portal protein [Pseudomonas phage PIP]|nr:portal protein [Pseudomonas phage PIP]